MSRRKKAARAQGLNCPRCGNEHITKQGLYYQCTTDPKLQEKSEYPKPPPGTHSCGFFGKKNEFGGQKTF